MDLVSTKMFDTSNDEVAWEAITEIKEYVDNGILFFVYNKVNFMSHEDILAICKDFYSEDDVTKAKSLMYAKYKCPEKEKTHRGTAKKVNDLKEIISFLSQNVASDVTFCITKCTQVPSVSMEFIDAPSMSRHMSLLRMEMELMSAKYLRLSAKVEGMESILTEKQGTPPIDTVGEGSLSGLTAVGEFIHNARKCEPKLSMAEIVRDRNEPAKDKGIKIITRCHRI